MKLALCNEVLRDLELAAQCAMAAELGYAGLELAPFTLDREPHRLASSRRVAIRRAVEDAGLRVSGLHWLLVTPTGLSVTSPDRAVRVRTVDVMRRMVALCAELGGDVLVHGSPAQRTVAEDDDPAAAWERARDCFAAAAEAAGKAGVTYCVEALSPAETNFITDVAEAVRMVEAVGRPGLATMLDTAAAAGGETESPAALLDRWLPTGRLAHVQVNDRNRRGPGQGEDRFGPVLAALARHRYEGWIAVEPFVYRPDGPTTAARAAGYLQGLLETLS